MLKKAGFSLDEIYNGIEQTYLDLIIARIKEFNQIEKLQNKLHTYDASVTSQSVFTAKNGPSLHKDFIERTNTNIAKLTLKDSYVDENKKIVTVFDRAKKSKENKENRKSFKKRVIS